MNVKQVNGDLAKLLGATNVKKMAKNVAASELLEKAAKMKPPKIDTSNMVPKARKIIDFLV